MKCLSSWLDHCEMLVASMKAAAKVVMLPLYSTSEDCAKHARVRAEPPLSKALTGVEKIHFISMQAMVSVVCDCCCSVLWFQYG